MRRLKEYSRDIPKQLQKLVFGRSRKFSFSPEDDIPKWIQKSEFCQSQRPRFKSIEAAPIPLDRSDGEGFKDGDADAGKNRFLSLLGYIRDLKEKLIF